MKPSEVLPTIVDRSGLSKRALSIAIGRSPSFVASTIFKDSILKLDTLTLIADACGYDVKLEKRDGTEVIEVDPPVDD